MEEILKQREKEFFLWLSKEIPAHLLTEIKNSYKVVNVMLLQKKLLPAFLCSVTQIGIIEIVSKQVNTVFANKQLRKNAVILLHAYKNFLSKTGNARVSNREEENLIKNEKANWIRYDFTNAKNFERTSPVYCCVNGEAVVGKNWARVLIALVEDEIAKKNSLIVDLYDKPLHSSRKGNPFFLTEKLEGLNCAELKNGYWINVNYSIPNLLKLIEEFCLHCGYKQSQIVLYGIRKVSANSIKKRKVGEKMISEYQMKNVKTTYTDASSSSRTSTELPNSVEENSNMQIIVKAIKDNYPRGVRFEQTVINLLEMYSNLKISEDLISNLQQLMFLRSDGLYFLVSMLENEEQHKILQKGYLFHELEQYGCIVLEAFYKKYTELGDNLNIRNKTDFEDYIKFLMPSDIRVRSCLKSRIIRPSNKTNEEVLREAMMQVVNNIKERSIMTEEDLLLDYPYYTVVFLHELLTKRTDEIIQTKINDFLCYQSIESIQFEDNISEIIKEVLKDITLLSLKPSEEILNALISVRLGYNFCKEYGIADINAFHRIISMYYKAETKREWKAGCFAEAKR